MSHTSDMQRWVEEHGHWDDHPFFPVEDWRHEVADSDTRQSYKEWLLSKAEQMDDESGAVKELPPHPLDLAYWDIADPPTFDEEEFLKQTREYLKRNPPFGPRGKTLMEVFAEEDDGSDEVPQADS